MAEFTFRCPKCSGEMKANAADVGLQGECPECKGTVVVPTPPQAATPSQTTGAAQVGKPSTPPKQDGRGFAVAGWICFGLGMLLICLFPFSLPLFIAAFAFGIASIVMNRAGQGVALIICSVCIPIIATILLPLLLAGSLLSALGLGALAELGKSQKPPPRAVASPVKQPAPRVIVSPGKKEIPVPLLKTSDELVQFLAQMEGYSRAHARESTTVKKDEMRKAAIAQGEGLLVGQVATFTVVIRDVGVPVKDITPISASEIDLGSYKLVADKTLRIATFDHYRLALNREQALTVVPGAILELTGRLWFDPKAGYFGPSSSTEATLLRIAFQSEGAPIGLVILKDMTWRIIPASGAGREQPDRADGAQ